MLPTASSLVEKLPKYFRRHALIKGWMKITGENPIQKVRIRDNTFAYADMREGFLRLIVIEKEFETEFFSIADLLLYGGGTFFDIGANYGLLSFGLGARHENVSFHLFEPNPLLVAQMNRTLQEYPNMRIWLNNVAVSNQYGTLRLKINLLHTGGSHISAKDEEGVVVQAIRLDDYINDHAIEKIDLMKIDVEGFELPALEGASNSLASRRINAVYFEYAEKQLKRFCNPEEVLEFFKSVGFTVCFCRSHDYAKRGGITHYFDVGSSGRRLEVLPIEGYELPQMTDLLAIPKELLKSVL